MQLNDITISELFERDPETLTQEEFEEIIKYYRANRTALVEAKAEGKRAPSKRKQSLKGVSLKDLGLA